MSGKRAAPGRHSGQARLEETPKSDSPRRRGSASLLLLALGITAAVVAWGYLVYLAIDFGTTARDGDGSAWFFLALATVGAIACLFLAMIFGTRLVTRLRTPTPTSDHPRQPGGRRAAR